MKGGGGPIGWNMCGPKPDLLRNVDLGFGNLSSDQVKRKLHRLKVSARMSSEPLLSTKHANPTRQI